MAEMSVNERAYMIFKSLCDFLDNNNWSYGYNEEERAVDISFQGEDFPIEINIVVWADSQIIFLYSHLPFVIPEDKRIEGAIAACVYSHNLVAGNFYYNINKGTIDFHLAQSFNNRTIGDDLFMYMINLSITIVEKYNDKFFALSKGMLNIDEIINQQN